MQLVETALQAAAKFIANGFFIIAYVNGRSRFPLVQLTQPPEMIFFHGWREVRANRALRSLRTPKPEGHLGSPPHSHGASGLRPGIQRYKC